VNTTEGQRPEVEHGFFASLPEAIASAALQARHDRPNNDHPADTAVPDKARLARARMKVLVVLDNLMAIDPDFEGLGLATDKLYPYVKPPREYYRAVVELGISLFQVPAVRELSSADLRKRLQARVKLTGYSVPRNCCNKPLFDWQLEEIAKATGVPFDRRRINSLCKLQSYAEARASGDDMWQPFNVSGFYSNSAVSFVEGCKPGKHKLFTTSTGYPVFKRNGKQITLPTFKALVE
jgi:hypothetical protein